MNPERGENITPETTTEISPELQRAANQARDALLHGDKETFKEFRRNHPEVPIDFSGKSITVEFDDSLDLSNCKFIGADLMNSRIKGGNFKGADFSGANFAYRRHGFVTGNYGTEIKNCDFRDAKFVDSEMSWIYMDNCIFSNANFEGTRMNSTVFGEKCRGLNEEELLWARFSDYIGDRAPAPFEIESEPDRGQNMIERIMQKRNSILSKMALRNLDEAEQRSFHIGIDIYRSYRNRKQEYSLRTDSNLAREREAELQRMLQQGLDERGKRDFERYVGNFSIVAGNLDLAAENQNLERMYWGAIPNLRMTNCEMQNSTFKSNCQLENCDLHNSEFNGNSNLKLTNCNLQGAIFKGEFGDEIDFSGSSLSNANFKDAIIYKRQIESASNTENVIWPDKTREKIDEEKEEIRQKTEEDIENEKKLRETYDYYEKLGVKLPSCQREYAHSRKFFFKSNIDIYEEQEERLDEQDRINWPVVYSIETKNMREKLSKKEMTEVFIVLYALKKSLKLDKNQMKRATDILAIKQRDKTVFWTTEDAVADAVQDVSEGAVLGREEYRRLASSTRRSF